MAQIHTVMKARKLQGACGRCGAPIVKGDGYQWVKLNRWAGRMVRCATCAFRPSELTSNDKLAAIYAAREDAEAATAAYAAGDLTGEGVAEALEATGEAVREQAQAFEEAANNIEDGFGHETCQCEELRDSAGQAEDEATEWEEAASGVAEAATALDDAVQDVCGNVGQNL